MAQENVGININVQSNADKTLGSLKQQLKEATAEVQALSDKFGATSEQAITAAKRAAELKDQIGDAKSLVDAFNPDAKFKALTASLSGVAGGFAAAQGAIALFGVESKEVEKALLQVQSAMALSQGLQAVGESIDSFKQLGSVIANSTIFLKANEMANKATAFAMRLFGVSVEATSVSFKVLKGAIAATGLGLLVVAIGEIVAAFQNYSSAAEKAAEKQKQLNDTIVKGAKVALKAEQDFIANKEKIDIAKAKSAGASEKQIFDIEQKYRKDRAESQKRFLKETENADIEGAISTAAEIKKINIEIEVAELEFKGKQAAARKAASKQEAENRKKDNEDRLAAEKEALQKLADLRNKLFLSTFKDENEKKIAELNLAFIKEKDEILANTKITEDLKNQLIVAARLQLNADLDAIAAAEKQKRQAADAQLLIDSAARMQKEDDDEFAALQAKNKKLFQENVDFKEADGKLDKLSAEQKIALAQQTSDALLAASAVIGKETAAGKALAISAALINTYQGISAAVKLPFPASIPAVAFAAATGFGAVKNIIATKVPGAAGGSAGNMTTPNLNAGAPIGPPQPQAQTTSLDNRTINAIGNQAVRAYVIENDVTSNQQRIAAIRQRARFG